MTQTSISCSQILTLNVCVIGKFVLPDDADITKTYVLTNDVDSAN